MYKHNKRLLCINVCIYEVDTRVRHSVSYALNRIWNKREQDISKAVVKVCSTSPTYVIETVMTNVVTNEKC